MLMEMNMERKKLYNIIFNADTKEGKRFDIILLIAILVNVSLVIIESMPEIGQKHPKTFYIIDWIFTIIFTLEYAVRIYSSPERKKYILSYWGLIDFLSILPTYLSLIFVGYHYLLMIRVLRLLRVFRVLKLMRFTREGQLLLQALKLSAYKIVVFISFIFTFVVLIGSLMYVIEHGNPGFSSIPASIYWGIVTITTVGFGDIVPATYLGKCLASLIMLSGYAIIAVPTGIVTVELNKMRNKKETCINCNYAIDGDDKYCSKCGTLQSEEYTY